MSSPERLQTTCPDCGSRLVVDAATGEVLSHRKPKAPPAGGADFDQLLADIDKGKREAEDVFDREVAALKDRDRLMEEKFQEALKRAEEDDDDTPPVRPWDLD